MIGMDTRRRSSDDGHRNGSAEAIDLACPSPFAVEVQRRDDVASVAPRGDLDLATVDSLSSALNGIDGAGRLVLDLRGLSFIDSSGLQLLVALHHRAQREGFELSLIAPASSAGRAIELCGLDKTLPFAPADGTPSGATADHGGGLAQ